MRLTLRKICFFSLLLLGVYRLNAQSSVCYQVRYHLRGGLSSLHDTCIPDMSLFNLRVDATSVSRSGFEFLGWANDSDTNIVAYPVGSQWNMTVSAVVNLYAVWRSICSPGFDTVTVSACDSYRWQLVDNLYTQSIDTTVILSGLIPGGCDSSVTLHLSLHHSSSSTRLLSVCDSLVWNPSTTFFTDTVGLCDSLTNSQGCDSLVTINLHVAHSTFKSYPIVACDSFSWSPTGRVFYSSASDTALYRTVDDCDSIETLSLTIRPSFRRILTPVVCDSFYWTSTSRTYYSSLQDSTVDVNQYGCDSVNLLNLTVHHSSSSTISHSVCDSVYWVDTHRFYYESQIVDYTIYTQAGCDSSVRLHLSVYPSYHIDIFDSVCEVDEYEYNGGYYSSGGTFYFRYSTAHQCDSNIVLHLKILSLPTISVDKSANCDDLFYEISVQSSERFLRWNSYPYDPSLQSQLHSNHIVVRPTQLTDYTVTSDCSDNFTTCPSILQVRCEPLVRPTAQFEVNPEAITFDHPFFFALDHSKNLQWRLWYIDDVFWGSDPKIWCAPSLNNDSIQVMLVSGASVCTDTARKTVRLLYDMLYVPNAFTPEGQDNNTFRAFGKGIIDFNISIFNRWGNLVFRSNNIEDTWNGTDLSGTNCPTGNYIYQIRFTDQTQPRTPNYRTGSILLIR